MVSFPKKWLLLSFIIPRAGVEQYLTLNFTKYFRETSTNDLTAYSVRTRACVTRDDYVLLL